MAKDRYRCAHCGTEGNFRSQQPLATAREVEDRQMYTVATSTCRDKTKCNARLRKANGTRTRHNVHASHRQAAKAK